MQCNVSTGCRIGPEQKTAAIKLNDKGNDPARGTPRDRQLRGGGIIVGAMIRGEDGSLKGDKWAADAWAAL